MNLLNEFSNNRILSALPQQEHQNLRNCLELVQLPLGEILLKPNQKIESVYFLTQGVVSLISTMQDGSTTEIGLIGTEGMVGTPQFLGDGVLGSSRAEVQIQGEALRIDATALRIEYKRSELLQKLILQYSLSLFNQVSQCAACNNHHTVKQRTARWLLMLDDRLGEETFLMTQQLLSKMLGVRRTGVTEIAKEIQRQGIIDYHRGKITILDRKALEAIACECYQIVRI
ncbi:MAG: Crp/Fnr family transcriptional regulator [Pleurocapsa sp.]